MNKFLKILHLEDMPEDAELVSRTLKKGLMDCKILHVEDRLPFLKALMDFAPDIILSDHRLPSFDSHEALELVKQMGLDIPFILVTATVSEEYAVTIIKKAPVIIFNRSQLLPNAVVAAMHKYHLEQEERKAVTKV